MYIISPLLEPKLLEMPETGMGFQVIELVGDTEISGDKFIVFNAEIAIELDEHFQANISKFHDFNSRFSPSSLPILNVKPENIFVLSRADIIEKINFILFADPNNRRNGGKGATDNAVEIATGKDLFVRVSAYENDKRIDTSNKCLKPGSFTTTMPDYTDCVVTEDDPIDRYALPGQKNIMWCFYFKPVKGDTLQNGIVQPAFNHQGGGLEVFYDRGTSPDTYIEKKEYG